VRDCDDDLTVVGGGLAGCEAAWQAANRGIHVMLFEMRPARMTPAHVSINWPSLCAAIASAQTSRPGRRILKRELRQLGSLILRCADETAVPAGGALAVGPAAFCASGHAGHHPSILISHFAARGDDHSVFSCGHRQWTAHV